MTHPPQLGPDGEFDADLPVGAVSVSPESKAKNEQRGVPGCCVISLTVMLGVILIPMIIVGMIAIDALYKKVSGRVACDLEQTEWYSEEWLTSVQVMQSITHGLYAVDMSGEYLCDIGSVHPKSIMYDAHPSPNGRYLQLFSLFTRYDADSRLMILDTQTHELRHIAEVYTPYATWSPNSRFLVYGEPSYVGGSVKRVDPTTFEQINVIHNSTRTGQTMQLEDAAWIDNQNVILQLTYAWSDECSDGKNFYQVDIDTLSRDILIDGLCFIDNAQIDIASGVIIWDQMTNQSSRFDREKIESCNLNLDTREIVCEPAPTDAS